MGVFLDRRIVHLCNAAKKRAHDPGGVSQITRFCVSPCLCTPTRGQILAFPLFGLQWDGDEAVVMEPCVTVSRVPWGVSGFICVTA